MRLFRREAGRLVGGLCCVVLLASLTAMGFLYRELERAEKEIASMRSEAMLAAQTHAERSAQDRALLEQVDRELAQSSAEREAAMAEIEMEAQIVAGQQARIEQLKVERNAAVQYATEQLSLVVDRHAMLEDAVSDRAQAVQERDQAIAERDATMIETRRALRQLDAETRTTIADIEKVIVATGLEPSRLLPEPNRIRRVGARGGPFIPWKAQLALAEHAESSQLHTLTVQVEKLKALRDVMVRLPLVAPVTHAILSDGFGYRRDPVNGGGARHEGLDLRAVRDSAVIAPAAGTVVAAGWDGAFGNLIQIDHGFGVVSRYAHLSRMLVRKGDVVARNEQIGVVGATGRATGVHLHYEIWVDGQPRDPMRFISAVSRPFVGFVRQ